MVRGGGQAGRHLWALGTVRAGSTPSLGPQGAARATGRSRPCSGGQLSETLDSPRTLASLGTGFVPTIY